MKVNYNYCMYRASGKYVCAASENAKYLLNSPSYLGFNKASLSYPLEVDLQVNATDFVLLQQYILILNFSKI